MRQLKFKAYKPVHGDDDLPAMTMPFTLGNLQDKEDFEFTDGMYSSWDDFGLEHKDCVVMQFTGLKDVDSVDIYEHDIVGFGDDSPSCNTGFYGELGTVFYCEDTCSFKVRLLSTLREVPLDDHNMFSSGKTCRKVYGNSYEHTELTGNSKL
jgi:hypothetical protein